MVSLWFRKVSCPGFGIPTQPGCPQRPSPGASPPGFLSGFLCLPDTEEAGPSLFLYKPLLRLAHRVEGGEFRRKKKKDPCRARAAGSHADVLGDSDGWEMFRRVLDSGGAVGWFCRNLKSAFVSLAPLGAPGDGPAARSRGLLPSPPWPGTLWWEP